MTPEMLQAPGPPQPTFEDLMGEKPGRLTAAGIAHMLSRKYPPPAWAFLEQVPDGTGQNKNRTLDGLAMSLWPSRGLRLHGFEIKISRSDLMAELNHPRKTEEGMAYCHYVWLVLADKKLIQPGELPPTWGLQAVRGRGLEVLTEAPLLTPKPIDLEFLAAILRRQTEGEWRARDLVIREAEGRGRKVGEREAKEELDRVKTRIEKFEKASGLRVDTWEAVEVGEAVRLLIGGKTDRIEREVRWLMERALEILETATTARNGLLELRR